MKEFFYKNFFKNSIYNVFHQIYRVQEDGIQSSFQQMTTSNSHHVLPLNIQLPPLHPDSDPPRSTASEPSGASEVAGLSSAQIIIVTIL